MGIYVPPTEVCEDRRKPVLANDVQVGGTHYKELAIQPWDYIAANGLGYFEGCAIKYITRWKDKGGVDDLKKASHYLQKLIETAESEKNNGQGQEGKMVRRS